MSNNNNQKLKREITKRWGLIRTDETAYATLEYILQEAGLLAKPRKRRKSAEWKPKPATIEATRTGDPNL